MSTNIALESILIEATVDGMGKQRGQVLHRERKRIAAGRGIHRGHFRQLSDKVFGDTQCGQIGGDADVFP